MNSVGPADNGANRAGNRMQSHEGARSVSAFAGTDGTETARAAQENRKEISMKFRRKVALKTWSPSGWNLRLECGHETYRSSQFNERELPVQVPCKNCELLIGQQVQDHLGQRGRITGYKDGLFAIAWTKSALSHATLDELREKAEIIMAA